MSDLFDLTKKVEFVLEKNDIQDIECQVFLDIDISGSMQWLYNAGIVQRLVTRILAIGMNVDSNKSIDVWSFTNKCKKIDSATQKNYEKYSDLIIKQSGSMAWGGTTYSPVLRDNLEFFTKEKKKSLFSLPWSKKSAELEPVLGIMVTDGENEYDDTKNTRDIIKNSAEDNIYWMFIGIGKSSFLEIKQLGDEYDNVGNFNITNLSDITDDELYEQIFNPEFVTWLSRFKK